MDLLTLRVFLAVVCAIIPMVFAVVGVSAFYGIKIYFLVKRERSKKPPKR